MNPQPPTLSLTLLTARRVHAPWLSIKSSDVLLWRHGPGLIGRVIAAVGRGEYCHAAMACWLGGELLALETVQFHGGRSAPLARQVADYPGRIDWFRVDPLGQSWDRAATMHAMMRVVGRRYGWWSLARLTWRRLPIVRLCVRPLTDDQMENGHAPFCSQAVSYALRCGGLDPVGLTPDRLTEPQDLARSAHLRLQGTLVP